MSLAVKPNHLKLTALCAGVLGLLLRFMLLQTNVDEKGLLISGHWADTAVWLLTAAVIGAIFFALRRCAGPEAYEAAFPASVFRCAGSVIAACGFLLTDTSVVSSAKLAAAEPVLRILAAAALIAVAYCRFRGNKPSFLLHGTVCLYLALRMVCRYQVWSSDPQLQDYAFFLGAHVALMLSCYQLAAFDADSGSHKSLWSWGLGAIYLCLTALPGSEEPILLLCCAVWMLTSLSSLTPTPCKGD